MTSQLIVSVGMPRSGSGWHFNLVHDLIVASGGKDARWIRHRYHLGSILTEVNCNIGAFTAKRLIPVMVPVLMGNNFVIKAHAGPSPLALRLIRHKMIIPTYIYRDPRDALLSAFEYGQRKREKNRSGAFSELETIEQAIEFMAEYIRISESWLACEKVFQTRYEDFLFNYQHETARLAGFFGIDHQEDCIKAIIEQYQPQKGHNEQVGTHFEKGKIGRYRKKLSKGQQALCVQSFGPYLEKMGYPIP
jgi:hypothetical protein